MSWSTRHSQSEKLASAAHLARQRGDLADAEANFVAAGRAEARALLALGADEPRTYGVTAVSAAALFFKGREFAEAEKIARVALKTHFLPDFAKEQIEEILTAIRAERAKEHDEEPPIRRSL